MIFANATRRASFAACAKSVSQQSTLWRTLRIAEAE